MSVFSTLIIVIIICLSILTFQRNKVWQSEFSLWSDTIQKSPQKARVHYNLGVSLGNLNKFDQAQNEFEAALNLNRDYASAYYNLAAIYEMKKDYMQAVKMNKEVLRLEPDNQKVKEKLESLNSEVD